MDEVFGEQNFIADFVWKKSSGGKQDSGGAGIAIVTEYVLMYAKNTESMHLLGLKKDYSSYKLSDEYAKRRGKYRLNQLDRSSLTYQPSLDYEIDIDGVTYRSHQVSHDEMIRRHTNHAAKDWTFRWSKGKVQWGLEHDFIVAKNGKLYSKEYENVDNCDREVSKTTSPYNVIGFSDLVAASSRQGNEDMKNIFGEKIFSYPKPVSLIRYLLSFSADKGSLILDFFAGSGTTGQAVAELNKEDGGHRRAILVTNNYEQDGAENGIARGVTAVRLRRVLTGEGWADGEKHDPLPGNLRYYRIGFKALSDDADVFTGAFAAPVDIAGVIALARGTHDVVSAESLAAVCPVLSSAVAAGKARVLTNGHGDRVLVYSDAVAVMNGDDEYEDVLAGFREWAGDKGAVYLASLDESDDDGVVYPLPYVRIVRRTVNGLERQGLLAREK
jgi:adenine-specific DNA-methyltransferase